MASIYVNKAEEAALNKLISFFLKITHTDNNNKDIYHAQQLSQKIKMSWYGAQEKADLYYNIFT